MKQVKLFASTDHTKLEKLINEFLKELKMEKVNIHYQTSDIGLGVFSDLIEYWID